MTNTENKELKNTNEPKNCCFSKAQKAWKEFSPSKTFIALSFLSIGVGATLITQNFFKPKYHDNFLSHHFPIYFSDAFANDDIFTEMEKMHQTMERNFAQHQERMAKIFSDLKKSDSNNTKITNSQDDQNYYYQLDFKGFKADEIQVSVKNNVISFVGEKKEDKNDKNKSANSSQNFRYSFSTPNYDLSKEPEIIKKDQQIIVKLAKKKNDTASNKV